MQWVHQEKKNFHTVDEFVNALLTHLQTCVVSGSFAPVDLKGMLQGTSAPDTHVSQTVVTCQAQPAVTSNTAAVSSTSSQTLVTAMSSVSQSPANTVTSATSGSYQNGLMRARPPPPPNVTPAIFLQATSFQARLRAQAASHISSAPTMQQQVFPSAAIILQPQQQQQQQHQAMPSQQVINVTQPIDLTQQCNSKQRDVLDLRMTSQGREQLVASNQCIQRLQQLIDQHSMQEQSLMQVQPQNVQMPNAVPYVESTASHPPAYTQNMAGNLQGNDLSFINSASQAYILAELPAGVLLQDRMLGSVGEMLSDGTAMDTVPTVPPNDSDTSYHNPEQLQVPGIGESPVTEFVDPSALHVSTVVDDSALMGTPDLPSWSNSPISALEQAPT
ncbi:general transcriptional corepressor CYC8-like [Branchiostoma floridae]|uniref:General transcriptional corepressor CYC8-like n=1 Tax=Branchiostoma floridae TaxID=7739 RepID=A0A9J7L7J3_BRAFL|nr:general transcriptional corepressor CYC8-like [Branchiostoma floridae]XP_035677010.1 general transcriptional corepressor CYC8-like [Branchiostoma floridae]